MFLRKEENTQEGMYYGKICHERDQDWHQV